MKQTKLIIIKNASEIIIICVRCLFMSIYIINKARFRTTELIIMYFFVFNTMANCEANSMCSILVSCRPGMLSCGQTLWLGGHCEHRRYQIRQSRSFVCTINQISCLECCVAYTYILWITISKFRYNKYDLISSFRSNNAFSQIPIFPINAFSHLLLIS